MFSKKISISAVLALSVFSANAFAQENKPVQQNGQATNWLSDWGVSFQLSQIDLTPSAAKRTRLKESSTMMSLAGDRLWKDYHLSLSTGLDIQLYGDKGGFSQNTTDGMKDSSASGGTFHVQAGPQFVFGENDSTQVFLHAGYNQVLSNSRSIDNCSDCYSEKIKIKGGSYVAAGVGYTIGGANWGIQYTKYSGGDFKGSIGIRIASKF